MNPFELDELQCVIAVGVLADDPTRPIERGPKRGRRAPVDQRPVLGIGRTGTGEISGLHDQAETAGCRPLMIRQQARTRASAPWHC